VSEILIRSIIQRMTLGLIALCLLLLLTSTVSAIQTWDDVDLKEVDHWKDPAGNGADLMMDISHDLDRLLLVGYGSPDEIRVVDRDVNTIATLVPPGSDPTVKGARWSESGTWIVAWGRAGGNDSDFLTAWNGTTYEPANNLFENDTTPLVEITSAVFMASDDILFISGRDVNGTSKVILVETKNMNVHINYTWENDATVTFLGADRMSLLCIDETGVLTSIGGTGWTDIVRFEEGSIREPSSQSITTPGYNPWAIGYEDGSVYFWEGYPIESIGSTDLGNGPVQGITWTFTDIGDYYMVAIPGEGQGSRLTVLYNEFDNITADPVSDTIDTGSSVTLLMMDPKAPGNVWAAFADGSLAYYNTSFIIDLPPEVTIDVPNNLQEYTGKVRFEGRFSDDHDRVVSVMVRIDTDEWVEAELIGNVWWYEVDTDLLYGGLHNVTVRAFDGRHTAEWRGLFNTPQEYNEDRDEWPPGIPLIPMLIIGIVVVVYLIWRVVRRTEGDDDQDAPPSS
jgi:hypothetical protein